MERYRLWEIWSNWERKNKRRLTQEEVAKKTGVSTHLLNRILNNENTTIETLEKLAKFFETETRDMLTRKDPNIE